MGTGGGVGSVIEEGEGCEMKGMDGGTGLRKLGFGVAMERQGLNVLEVGTEVSGTGLFRTWEFKTARFGVTRGWEGASEGWSIRMRD